MKIFIFLLVIAVSTQSYSQEFAKILDTGSKEQMDHIEFSLSGKFFLLSGDHDIAIFSADTYDLLKTIHINRNIGMSEVKFTLQDTVLYVTHQEHGDWLFDKDDKKGYLFNWFTEKKIGNEYANAGFEVSSANGRDMVVVTENQYYYFDNSNGTQTKAPRRSFIYSQIAGIQEKQTATFEFEEITDIAFSHDGKKLAVSFHKYALILDAVSLEKLDSIPALTKINPPRGLHFTADDNYLFYYYTGKELAYLYDLNSKKEVFTYSNIDRDFGIQGLSANENFLLVDDGRYCDLFTPDTNIAYFSDKYFKMYGSHISHVNCAVLHPQKNELLISGYQYSPNGDIAVSLILDIDKYQEYSNQMTVQSVKPEKRETSSSSLMTQQWHNDDVLGSVLRSENHFLSVSKREAFLWDKSSMKRVNAFYFPDDIKQYGLSDDGKLLFVLQSYTEFPELINIEENTVQKLKRTNSYNFEYSDIDNFLICGSDFLVFYDNYDESFLYDVGQNAFVKSFKTDFQVQNALIAYQVNDHVYSLLQTEEDKLIVHDVSDNKQVFELKMPGNSLSAYNVSEDFIGIVLNNKLLYFNKNDHSISEKYSAEESDRILDLVSVSVDEAYISLKSGPQKKVIYCNFDKSENTEMFSKSGKDNLGLIDAYTAYSINDEGIEFFGIRSGKHFESVRTLGGVYGSLNNESVSAAGAMMTVAGAMIDMENAKIINQPAGEGIQMYDSRSYLKTFTSGYYTDNERLGILHLDLNSDTLGQIFIKKSSTRRSPDHISISPDKKKAVTISSDYLYFWDLQNYEPLGQYPCASYDYRYTWSSHSDYFAFISEKDFLTDRLMVYNLNSKKASQVTELDWAPFTELAFTSSDSVLFFGENNITKYNIYSNEIGKKKYYHNNMPSKILYVEEDDLLIVGLENGEIYFWNAIEFELKNRVWEQNNAITDIKKTQNLLFTSSADHSVCIWDMDSAALMMKYYQFYHDGQWKYCFITPDGYYKASKSINDFIHFSLENVSYPFEQFDLKYNRPDIVLERLGYASPELIEAYHQAYLKRIKRMGFTEEQLSGEFHVPETKIENFEYMPVIDEKDIKLDLNFNDSKYKLDRYNIWINDVPVYGVYGKSLRKENTDKFSVKETIQLSEGENKIQVSCLNEKGAESYKETEYIIYEPKDTIKPDLYLVAVSVSEYQDSTMNLKYAVKDGRDMANLFAQNTGNRYENVYIDTLFDSNATIENVAAAKTKLMGSKVDDEVILYVSGHGLLDDKLDFYFASHNMDFSKPEKYGISYDLLEGLLDSIPARKKIFLMDACHSGEVDKENVIVGEEEMLAEDKKSGLKTYTYRGGEMTEEEGTGLGLQNSFELMQELFANLNRGSGAVVISAAAGNSYALESKEWNNGVFTYAILNGLINKEADQNKDGQIMVSELRAYVINKVEQLTHGLQKPTCRQENLEFDWGVW